MKHRIGKGWAALSFLLLLVPHTAFALDMQTLWNLGFNAMNLIALVAAILFVVAVTLILLSFLTGNKHPAAPAQAAVYEPAPEGDDEAYYDEGEADDTDGADASVPEADPDEDEAALPEDDAEDIPEAEAAEDETDEAEESADAGETEEAETVLPRDGSLILVLDGINIKDRLTVEVDSMITIGRKSDNDLIIPDTVISGIHCTVERRGGTLYLRDNHSTNGTFVDDTRLHDETALRDGSTLQLGGRKYRVYIHP